MLASVRAMMAGILDYAGLFPPAKLALDEAIRNYAGYRTEPESWMLGRFVCPAARLTELAPYHDLFGQGPPWTFTVLGRSGNTDDEFLEGLRADLEAIATFGERHGPQVVVDSYETVFPEAILRRTRPTLSAPHFLVELGTFLEERGPEGLTPYYEVSAAPDRKILAIHLLEALSRQVSHPRRGLRTRAARFKVRCGGLEASAFPSAADLAFVIAFAGRLGVPLKFTAGLHHTMRRFDPGVGATMHGFLNVFGAGVLRSGRPMAEERVREIIEDDDPTHFVFDGAGFRWNDLRATVQDIVYAREHAVVSFGSCSFDEPRDDLRHLGLLGKEP
jgi:hypothetical protein